jgi:hypothetical protein
METIISVCLPVCAVALIQIARLMDKILLELEKHDNSVFPPTDY